MYIKGLKRNDIRLILTYMMWNKYTLEQKPKEDCYDKFGTIAEMDRVRDILKSVI